MIYSRWSVIISKVAYNRMQIIVRYILKADCNRMIQCKVSSKCRQGVVKVSSTCRDCRNWTKGACMRLSKPKERWCMAVDDAYAEGLARPIKSAAGVNRDLRSGTKLVKPSSAVPCRYTLEYSCTWVSPRSRFYLLRDLPGTFYNPNHNLGTLWVTTLWRNITSLSPQSKINKYPLHLVLFPIN